jgi:peptidoglycan/LPS O-acetylase OafA/YrhL
MESSPLEKSRSIPSLDGLRAFSVLAVILGHTQSTLLDRVPFNAAFRDGGKGVAIFFVISGFLITHLLLKELHRDEKINLTRFYLRRTFRIFPPFYGFLLVVAVLAFFHRVHFNPTTMLIAGTYTWNYIRTPHTWVFAHCWSLTLEEQFYLLWPLCMTLFSRRTNLAIASGVILLSPLSRVVTYYAWPYMRENLDMMLHTHLDTIMTGCLLALIIDLKIWQKMIRVALSPIAPILSIAFLLTADTAAKQRFRGMYLMTIGITLENIAIAALLLYVVFRHESPLGRLLNLRPIRHFGMISYSLYLYQQLFTGPYTRQFPLNILFIVAAAELSYLFVEKPSFRIREFVQKRHFSSKNSERLAEV